MKNARSTWSPLSKLGTLMATLSFAFGCATTVQWGRDERVRADHERELSAILQKTQADPIRGCDKVLPKAVASGRFADSWLFDYNELSLLSSAKAAACGCKKRLFSVSEVPPASEDALPRLSLSALVAIGNSPNQLPAVEKAVVNALKRRIPTAGVDELATLYARGKEAMLNDDEPLLRYQDHDVACFLRANHRGAGKHGLELVNIRIALDPAVKQMIAKRRRSLQESAKNLAAQKQREEDALQQAEKAEQAAKKQEKATAEREARTTKIRESLAVALKHAHQNDLDGAEEALGQAKTLKEVDDQALQGEVDQALLTEIAAAGAVIAATPKAKQRDRYRQREEARIAREADQRTREEKQRAAALERRANARGGSYVRVMLGWVDRIERDLRHLVDVFASLHPPAGEPSRSEKEIVYAPMRQLCTTIKAMRREAPDVEYYAINLVIGSIANTEGDRDATTARGILGTYLEGDCYKTYRAAFSHR